MKFKHLLVFLLFANGLYAQDFMSHRAAPGEVQTIRKPAGYRNSNLAAPTQPVRAMAEWEEIEYLTITWASGSPSAHKTILARIVEAAQTECKVLILHNSDVSAASITNYIQNLGITVGSNVSIVLVPNDRIWIRDYGANTIYFNDVDSLSLVDWIYNRPRPLDDATPGALASYLNLPIYETAQTPDDLIHTGGNYMSDGLGTAFSSNLVLDENPSKTETEIDDIMQRYMGIDNYYKMETLDNDVIHHIDMHMKILDEETLLIGEYPQGVSDGPPIEANIQGISTSLFDYFGERYKIVRIPMPPDASMQYPLVNNQADYRTYTNAVFVNKTIIIPLYEERYDTTAIRIWQETMPGYRIVGINCNGIIGSLGAIHCITHSIGVKDPLLIVHNQLEDTYSTSAYNVTAEIKHRSGIASAILYYKTNTNSSYSSVSMTSLSGSIWSADIPGQTEGTVVYYYISATSNSGKTQVRPMPAPAGNFDFRVLSPVPVASVEAERFMAKIFPNPTSGNTYISLNTQEEMNLDINIYDALGQQVASVFNGFIEKGEQNLSFDLEKLTSGVYFVQLRSDGFSKTIKIMKR